MVREQAGYSSLGVTGLQDSLLSHYTASACISLVYYYSALDTHSPQALTLHHACVCVCVCVCVCGVCVCVCVCVVCVCVCVKGQQIP